MSKLPFFEPPVTSFGLSFLWWVTWNCSKLCPIFWCTSILSTQSDSAYSRWCHFLHSPPTFGICRDEQLENIGTREDLSASGWNMHLDITYRWITVNVIKWTLDLADADKSENINFALFINFEGPIFNFFYQSAWNSGKSRVPKLEPLYICLFKYHAALYLIWRQL